MISIQMLVYLALILLVSAQKYPSCPGGVPIDIGNATDSFYAKLLTLTDFMNQNDDGHLAQAFHLYATTKSTADIDKQISKNRKFYMIVIIILSTVSFMLLIVMLKIGNMQLTTKEIFQKVKEKGFSSPLSTFFALLAAILMVTTGINAYEIPVMMQSLDMTQCRMDVLNQVFLNGAPQQNWSGINFYADKVKVINQLSQNLRELLQGNVGNETNTLIYSKNALMSLNQKYVGIYHTYMTAVIGQTENPLIDKKLTELVPNLFENTTSDASPIVAGPFKTYLGLLEGAQALFSHLEHLLSYMQASLNGSIPILHSDQSSLRTSSAGYSNAYTSFRLSIAPFFAGSRSMLIICQVITALTLFGSIVALISIRLIQGSYDYFSLKIYKIVWGILLILFCLNIVFLMIFNEMIIYNKGMCTFSKSLLTNHNYLLQTFPEAQPHRGMNLITQCYYNSDFSQLTHTDTVFRLILDFVSIKEQVIQNFTPQHLSNHSAVLKEVCSTLKEYQFGLRGTYSYMDGQLAIINGYTNGNYKNEGCFKHHWQYGSAACNNGQQVKYEPLEVTYLNHTTSYPSISSECYIINNYEIDSNSSALSYDTFYSLYESRADECPYINSVMATKTVTFFNLLESRVNVVQSLIDSLNNLTGSIREAVSYLVTFTNRRISLLTDPFKNVTGISTYSHLSAGNDCGIIRNLINGAYNQFCINYMANSHQVYLLVVCNIGYIIGMIVISLLYAVELRHLSEKDLKEDEEESRNIQFVQTHMQFSSQSHSDLSSEGEKHSVEAKSQE